MPGVGTQLLFLLLLTAVVSARPAGTTEKEIESARRKARFGDYSFLCDLLCETVEDSEGDCSYLDWMSFDICDTICEESSSTATATPKPVDKPPAAKEPERATDKPKTADRPPTAKEPETATDKPKNADSPPAAKEPETATDKPKPADSPPAAKEPETATDKPKPADSPPAAKEPETATEKPKPADSPPAAKEPETATDKPKPADSPPAAKEPETPTPETSSDIPPKNPPADDATKTADSPPPDLEGSSNEVDIITVNLEGNSSSAQLESQETSDKAVSWQEFKTRLMPYLPELIKLWCEWREIFSNPTSTSALERLCPPVSNETALSFNSIASTS